MSYDSFETSKNKLEKLWNKEKENRDLIEDENDVIVETNNKKDKLNVFRQTFGGLEIIETTWQGLDFIQETLVKTFNLYLYQYPRNLIPHIRSEIILRGNSPSFDLITGTLNESTGEISFTDNVVKLSLVQILNEEDGLVNLKLHNYIRINEENVSFEAKLITMLLNTRDYSNL